MEYYIAKVGIGDYIQANKVYKCEITNRSESEPTITFSSAHAIIYLDNYKASDNRDWSYITMQLKDFEMTFKPLPPTQIRIPGIL